MKKNYPIKYIKPAQLEDGTLIQLRPIHPDDSQQAEQFRASLSDESIYSRFLGYVPKVSKKLIKHLVEIDYSQEMAIIAEAHKTNEQQVIGIARIVQDIEDKDSVEFAIIIADKWQGKKLGYLLTDFMLEVAKDLGYENIYGLIYRHNMRMLEILRKRGFEFRPEDSQTIRASLQLF